MRVFGIILSSGIGGGLYMKIIGDISSVQSNLDFYISLMAEGNTSIQELRKRYINIFLNEERSQMRLALDEIENRKMLEVSKEKELESENIKLETEIEDVSGAENELESENVSEVEEGSEVEDSSEVEEDSLFSSSFFLQAVEKNSKTHSEDEDSQNPVEVEKEGIVYVNHGVFLDELEYSNNKAEPESSVESNAETEEPQNVYVNHGVYLDEVSSSSIDTEVSNSEEVSKVEEVYEEVSSNVEKNSNVYVPHGVFLDEYSREAELDETEMEEDTVGYQGEAEDFTSTFDEDTSEAEEPLEEFTEAEEQPCTEEGFTTNEVIESKGDEVVDDLSTPQVDLRTFIKKHPGSTIEFVCKYYDKKEVDKQVKLGRVYKKKGKLFI